MFLFGLPNIAKMIKDRDFDGLARALEHRDRLVRLKAAQALAQLNDGRGWRYLLDTVQDAGNEQSQAVAAEMLGDLGHPRAVPALQEALPEARGDAAEAIRAALESLGVTLKEAEEKGQHIRPTPPPSAKIDPLLEITMGASLIPEGEDSELVQPVAAPGEAIQFHTAEQHLNAAIQLREAELQERGLVHASLALWLKPHWAQAWYIRGVLLEDLEREREAMLAYHQAYTLDHSQTDAKSAYDELESESGEMPESPLEVMNSLGAGNWRERRDACAMLGALEPEPRAEAAVIADSLMVMLEDDEREVRHAAIEALGATALRGGWNTEQAGQRLLEMKESSWLLRFAILQALSDIGSAELLSARLRSEMQNMQERNKIYTSHRDPLLELEYEQVQEIGALALERSGDLEGLLTLAEANAWEETDINEETFALSEYAWQEEEGDWEGEDGPYDELFIEDEETELLSYVDETSLMAAVALDRLARRRLNDTDHPLSPALIARLAAVPDLTLLDITGESQAPQVVYDFAALRSLAAEKKSH